MGREGGMKGQTVREKRVETEDMLLAYRALLLEALRVSLPLVPALGVRPIRVYGKPKLLLRHGHLIASPLRQKFYS